MNMFLPPFEVSGKIARKMGTARVIEKLNKYILDLTVASIVCRHWIPFPWLLLMEIPKSRKTFAKDENIRKQ